MTDALNEQLSACLDGELPQAELDLLLKRLDRDAELCRAMTRYSLIREALRDEKPLAASNVFAARVMAAVQEEPASGRRQVRIPPALSRRLRPIAGVAVAASVAAIAIFSVQRVGMLPTATVADSGPPASQTLVVQDDDPSYIVPPTTSPATFVPATRLTNYVMAHSEYSSLLGRRSVLTGVLAEDESERTLSESGEPADPALPAPLEQDR